MKKKRITTLMLATALLLTSPIITNAEKNSVEPQSTEISKDTNSGFKNFIDFVEKNLEVKNNKYVLKNPESIKLYIQKNFKSISHSLGVYTPDEAFKMLKERFENLNSEAGNGKIVILSNGSFYSDKMITARSNGHYVSNHWWGVRHAFYSRSAARNFANTLSNVSDLASAAATLFPGSPSSIVATLSSWYLHVLSSDIRSWANKTYHFNTDIAWSLNYRMYEN